MEDIVNNPLVVVVIPTLHNRPELINAAITSCLTQTYTNFIIFVVGDGVSYDGYLNLESQDSRLKFVQSKRGVYPESGLARWYIAGREPLNFGFELAKQYKADIVCRLDDDDLYMPNHLETIVNEYRKGKRGVVYTLPTYIDNTVYHTALLEFSPALLRQQNITFTCTLGFCGKKIVNDLHFPLQHAIPGDWAMLKILLNQGYQFHKVNTITTLHRYEAHHSSRKEI